MIRKISIVLDFLCFTSSLITSFLLTLAQPTAMNNSYNKIGEAVMYIFWTFVMFILGFNSFRDFVKEVFVKKEE